MEKADVEQSSDAVTRDAEKHAETDNVAPDKPAQEEEQQQAKARPKRVASFQDYLVSFYIAPDDALMYSSRC